MSIIKIGVECENLEDAKSRWGIGHLVLNLLEEYAKNPEWQKKFKLHLYFNKFVPDDKVLKNPVFIKRVLGSKIKSFNIFYHTLLPIKAMRDKIDYLFFPAYMLPPLYVGKAIVLLTNDVYYEYKSGALPFKYKMAYRLFTNWAAKRAEKIMAISEASKKEVARLYKIRPERIFVARLGVKQENSNDKTQTPNKIPNLFDAGNWPPKTGNYLLYVGQMFPRRHAKETILAFKKIARDFPNLKLILIGRDKYKTPIIDDLTAKINVELGDKRVIHYDYIESDKEIGKLYKNAKLFVYISDKEAFGLPPVEAASYSIPVVVKDNELNHELFEDAAFFVKEDHNIEEIADVLRRGLTYTEKRNYCIEKYKTLIPKLSWHNFAEKFFEEIENLYEKSS